MMNETGNNIIRAHVVNLTEPEIKPYSDVRSFNTTDFIPFGADNLFPQSLALFCRQSPNHRGILNSKNTYIMGDGLTTDDAATIDLFSSVNYESEMMHELLTRINLDYSMFGNGWWELITDANRSFLWLNQIDATKARLAKDGEQVILHPDWAKDTGKYDKYRQYMPLYPSFTPDTPAEDSDPMPFPAYRSVYHMRKYEPEFVYYGVPQYLSAKDSIQIDLKTNKWNLSRLKNSFLVSGMLIVPVKDEEESKTVLKYVEENYTGENNQAKLLTITKQRPTGAEKPEQAQYVETKRDDEGSWLNLHKQSLSDMIVSHGWFRALTGLADNTGFDTQRILNEYEVARNTVIKERQTYYINILRKLYREIVNIELPDDLMFINSPPIDTDDYKYLWELRAEKGLEIDLEDPQQNLIIIPTGKTINKSTGDGTTNTG